MLYYLSCLLGFYNAAHGLQKMSVSEMPAKFPGIPAQVLNGLCARFAEPVGKRFAVTDKCKMKLLAWICVCYLAADGWSVDVAKVAKELALPPTK
jgi:DNA-directed RNA polymerase I subunit RPA49